MCTLIKATQIGRKKFRNKQKSVQMYLDTKITRATSMY